MNKNNLKEIIQERDNYSIYTHQWQELNALKNHVLAEQKPSTKEVILYFDEVDLEKVQEGFSKPNIESLGIMTLDQQFASRFTLEYASGVHRHPIPYILVKNKDRYFFILREGGSGESRLIGKIGLLGGHVGIEDKSSNMAETIINGMMRELEEEAGITEDIILNSCLKGFIKSNDNDTDKDHLGLIYEIEINTDTIKAEEEGILSGIWVHKDEVKNYIDRMENWLKIVYDNVITEEIK